MAQFCPLTGRGVIVDVIANPEMTSVPAGFDQQ